MKKIICTILAMIMLLSALPVVSAATTTSDSKLASEAATLVEYLGIMNVSEKADKQITRADFAIYVARILNADEYAQTNKIYFKDIPTEHWASVSVNNLVELGIIKVDASQHFKPDEYITLKEATQIMVALVGYMPSTIKNGGSLEDYMAIASDLDMLDGVDKNGLFTRKNAAILISNTMHTDMYESTLKDGKIYFQQVEGKNLLGVYKDIYEYEGQVRAIGQTALYKGEELHEGFMLINDREFIFNGTTEYIGHQVKAYYKVSTEKDDEVVLMFSLLKDTDIIEIKGSQFEKFEEGYKLTYYESEESNKVSKISIPTSAAFIYNNMAIDENITDYANITNDGSIRIIRSKVSREFDIVIIRQARVVVAGHVDQTRKIVYDAKDTLPAGYFSEEIGVAKVYDANGKITSFTSLGRGSVVSIYKAEGNYIEARISDSSIYGKFEKAFEEDGKKYFRLDGVDYQVRDLYYDECKSNTVIGKTAAFKLDEFGLICLMTTKPSADTSYYIGYYLTCNMVDDYETKKIYMEIYSNHDRLQVYSLAESVVVDGLRKKKPEQIYTRLIDNFDKATDELSQQAGYMTDERARFLRFKLNELNEICEIDTPYRSDRETEYTLQMHSAEQRVVTTYPYTAGYNILYDTSTYMFTVPTQNRIASAGLGDFAIDTKMTNYPGGGEKNVVAYKWDPENPISQVIVIYGTISTTMDLENYHVMVEKYDTVLDEDDEPVDYLVGWKGGNQVRIPLSDNMVNQDGLAIHIKDADIKKGDIIMYLLDAQGCMVKYSLVYDYSQDKVLKVNGQEICTKNVASLYGQPGFRNVYLAADRISHGYPVKVLNKNAVVLSYEKNGPMRETYMVNDMACTVYDSTMQRNNIRRGTIGDLVISSQSKDCSTVIVIAESTYWRAYYVYN